MLELESAKMNAHNEVGKDLSLVKVKGSVRQEKKGFCELVKILLSKHFVLWVCLVLGKTYTYTEWYLNLFSIQYLDIGNIFISGMIYSIIDSIGISVGGKMG